MDTDSVLSLKTQQHFGIPLTGKGRSENTYMLSLSERENSPLDKRDTGVDELMIRLDER